MVYTPNRRILCLPVGVPTGKNCSVFRIFVFFISFPVEVLPFVALFKKFSRARFENSHCFWKINWLRARGWEGDRIFGLQAPAYRQTQVLFPMKRPYENFRKPPCWETPLYSGFLDEAIFTREPEYPEPIVVSMGFFCREPDNSGKIIAPPTISVEF